MRESRMRRLIKKHFGSRVFLQPIESHATPGIPDIFFYDQEPGWAELKEWNGNEIHFRPGQFTWLTKYWKLGGLSILICTTWDDLWVTFQGSNIKNFYGADWQDYATWIGVELPENVFCRAPRQ